MCFPHAGGSATYFYPLATRLAGPVDVLSIQYPGRQDRTAEPAVDDLHVLAEQLVPILHRYADVPLTFFGHSMGAVIAFEVARRLERDGTVLSGLFVSGRSAPPCHDGGTEHLLPDDELMRSVAGLGGVPAELLADPDVMAMLLPPIRSDYRAIETYRYRPGPDVSCPVTALLGRDDPMVSAAEARRWAERTTGAFRLLDFPGGHFYLADELPAVAAALAEHLGS